MAHAWVALGFTSPDPGRLGMDLTADITTRVETVLGFLLRKARLSTGV